MISKIDYRINNHLIFHKNNQVIFTDKPSYIYKNNQVIFAKSYIFKSNQFIFTDKPSWASESERDTSQEAAKSEIKIRTKIPNKGGQLFQTKENPNKGGQRLHTESKQRKMYSL